MSVATSAPPGNWIVRSSRSSEGIHESDSTVTPTVLVAIGQHRVACVEWFAPICDDSSGVGDCGFPRWLLENRPYRTRLHAPADSQRRIDADVADGSSSSPTRLVSKCGDFQRSHDGSADVHDNDGDIRSQMGAPWRSAGGVDRTDPVFQPG